jgi:hypothetical protein
MYINYLSQINVRFQSVKRCCTIHKVVLPINFLESSDMRVNGYEWRNEHFKEPKGSPNFQRNWSCRKLPCVMREARTMSNSPRGGHRLSAASETRRLLKLLSPEMRCRVVAWLVGWLFNDAVIIEYMATNLRYLVGRVVV